MAGAQVCKQLWSPMIQCSVGKLHDNNETSDFFDLEGAVPFLPSNSHEHLPGIHFTTGL